MMNKTQGPGVGDQGSAIITKQSAFLPEFSPLATGFSLYAHGLVPIKPSLLLKQMCIFPAKLNQLLVAAVLNNSAILEHINSIGHPHRGKTVADKDC